jgi:hypothetical protein
VHELTCKLLPATRGVSSVKKNSTKVRQVAPARERLNVLMEAVAFVIAQRQMKQHWPTLHRATLSSII